MMMRKVLVCLAATVVLAGVAAVAAPGQDRPGQPTQARVWIENRGGSQAIPVTLEGDSLNAPLRVHVDGARTPLAIHRYRYCSLCRV